MFVNDRFIHNFKMRAILALFLFVAVGHLSAQTVERAEVKPYMGRPALYINGVPTVPQFYALTDRPTGNRSYESQPSHSIALFAQAGFKLFQLDIWFEEMLPESGVLDITEARKQIQGVLLHCPDAAVMFRLHVNPPFWWLKRHPEECCLFADDTLQPEPYRPAHQNYLWQELNTVPRCSYASQAWQQWMEGQVAEFCRQLAGTPEGRHVMGIQIANGLNGEHHQWAFVKHDPDVSEPMQRYFRQFLKEKYRTDKALRKAWRQSSVTLATAAVPGMERHKTSAGIYRDPQKEQAVIDYYECQHKVVTQSILGFAAVVKENWPRPVTVGCFYGYYLSLFGRQAAGGHLCEQDILTSPHIDFLCAPQAYNKNSRLPGGPALSRGLVESVNLHGKLWLDEMDQPSHLGYVYLGGLQMYPLAESIQILRKFVLSPFLRGGGMWFYDFGPLMNSGWWDDPAYMADIRRMHEVEERYFNKEQASPADVLLVFDTKVFFHTASRDTDDPITDQTSVNVVPIEVFRSGVSAATCYLSDLPQMPLAQYKTVVFVNCFLLTPEQRQWIRSNVAKEGRSLVWLTAPGYNDGQTLDLRHVCETTGMQLDTFSSFRIPDLRFGAAFGDSLQKGEKIAEVGKTIFMNQKDSIRAFRQIFFSVKENGVNTLALFDSVFPTRIAGASLRHDTHTDYFFALPLMDKALWRQLFRETGCHIYDDAGDAVIAGSGLIMVHTADGGERTIRLRNGREVRVELQPKQTLLLDAESGEVVL